MSYSDYLSLKKIKNSSKDKNNYEKKTGSFHSKKKQIYHIQNTIVLDEDNERVNMNIFNILLKKIYFTKKKNNNQQIMYSIPRIHVPEYVKNCYEAPFCWTCDTPIDDILNGIACNVCDTIQPIVFELNEEYEFVNNISLDIPNSNFFHS